MARKAGVLRTFQLMLTDGRVVTAEARTKSAATLMYGRYNVASITSLGRIKSREGIFAYDNESVFV